MNINKLTMSLATALLICTAFLLPVTPATAVSNTAGEKSIAWQAEGEPDPTLPDTTEPPVSPDPETITEPAATPPPEQAPELPVPPPPVLTTEPPAATPPDQAAGLPAPPDITTEPAATPPSDLTAESPAPPAPDVTMQLAADTPPDQAPELPVPPPPDITAGAADAPPPPAGSPPPPAGPMPPPAGPMPPPAGSPPPPADPTAPLQAPLGHRPPPPPPGNPPPPPPPPSHPPISRHHPVQPYPYYPYYSNYPYYPYDSDPYVWPYPYARWSPYVGTYSSAIVVETPQPQPTYTPVISSFTANPSYIEPGQSSVLTWSTNNASEVTISPSVGSVPGTGVYTVMPAYTTTYTLTATGTGGSVTASTTITVAQYYSTYTTSGSLSSTDGGTTVPTGTGGVVTSGVSAGSSPALNLWLLYALMIGLLAVAAGVIITLLVRKPANAYAKAGTGTHSGYLASSTAPAATLPASSIPMTTPLAAGPSVKFTSEGGRELSLSAGGQSIGRSDLHGFAVPGKADLLSRQHFSLSHENNDYYIEDRGSTNGTRLNGSEIRGRGKQLIKDGDKIELAGALTITFKS